MTIQADTFQTLDILFGSLEEVDEAFLSGLQGNRDKYTHDSDVNAEESERVRIATDLIEQQ